MGGGEGRDTPASGPRALRNLWSHVLPMGGGTLILPQVLSGGAQAGTGVPPGWDWGTPTQMGLGYPPPPAGTGVSTSRTGYAAAICLLPFPAGGLSCVLCMFLLFG